MDTCAICLSRDKQHGQYIYEDEYWVLRHSQETNILGYLVLESRRHFLDLSYAQRGEYESYGFVLASAMTALRKVCQCQRVYTFSLGEAVPHFHLHIIPRSATLPRAFRGRGIMVYPLNPPCDPALVDEVVFRLRQAFKKAYPACRQP